MQGKHFWGPLCLKKRTKARVMLIPLSGRNMPWLFIFTPEVQSILLILQDVRNTRAMPWNLLTKQQACENNDLPFVFSVNCSKKCHCEALLKVHLPGHNNIVQQKGQKEKVAGAWSSSCAISYGAGEFWRQKQTSRRWEKQLRIDQKFSSISEMRLRYPHISGSL